MVNEIQFAIATLSCNLMELDLMVFRVRALLTIIKKTTQSFRRLLQVVYHGLLFIHRLRRFKARLRELHGPGPVE